MPTPIETTVQTYVAVLAEPDPAKRAAMIATCFAEDGRIVARSREFRGHAEITAMIDRFLAQGMTAQLASAIDAQGSTFRFRASGANADGSPLPEVFDAGMVGPDGRITLILTFAGPLANGT